LNAIRRGWSASAPFRFFRSSMEGAGERLYAVERPSLEDLRAAVAAVGEMGDAPRGSVRFHVSTASQG
jgi:hypothetical protein